MKEEEKLISCNFFFKIFGAEALPATISHKDTEPQKGNINIFELLRIGFR